MDFEKNEKIAVIILAGGTGRRMGADIPKQYMELKGKPVLAYSLIAFENSPADEIYVVCDPVYEDMIRMDIIGKYGITKFSGFACSGTERVWSVKNGIETALAGAEYEDSDNIYLMIHDGARPLVSRELIERCLENVKKHLAVVPGIPLKDTIKEISHNIVTSTPDRHSFVAVQTPQCFRADVIMRAYDGFDEQKVTPTDDSSLVEMFSDTQVVIVPGEESNLKITTPVDMKTAELFLCM